MRMRMSISRQEDVSRSTILMGPRADVYRNKSLTRKQRYLF